jgi:hypothetical protein
MTHAPCENRLDVLPGQGQARSDRPFKKTGLAKKGNADVSAADQDPGLDAQKKSARSVREKTCAANARTFDGLAGTACGTRGRNAASVPARRRRTRLDAVRLPKTGCGSPVAPVSGKKRVECTPGCGQAAAYPQDAMCRTPFTEDWPFFFQHRCRPDTILVPRVP